MTRDLASQTQKLVQSKLTIQQLHDQNSDLQSDLHLALTLLQTHPRSYSSQRVDSLPADVQQKVRNFRTKSHNDSAAKKIRVPIMEEVSGDVGEDEKVSAAILAKVLEERDKERTKENKFCIDVGTQTHGWHLAGSANGENGNGGRQKGVVKNADRSDTADVIQILRSISLEEVPKKTEEAPILLASVIRSPPTMKTMNEDDEDVVEKETSENRDRRNRNKKSLVMKRSATFSATETDL